MGSVLSSKQIELKSKIKSEPQYVCIKLSERKTFKEQRIKLLEANILPPEINTLIYEYAFEYNGILLYSCSTMLNENPFKYMHWFDGSKRIFIQSHPLSEITRIFSICTISNHIICLGGNVIIEMGMNLRYTKKQTYLYKYNYCLIYCQNIC